ncbi:MAG: CHAT domain-containing protein [Aetokthonos hydrillicola CCALA 1050]|nr:CHAT domain-containing protein [Aetokthonos hydrillicola CCALA 1050]
MLYHRLLRFILLALFTLITTVSVPIVLEHRAESITVVTSQVSKGQVLLEQGIELYNNQQFSEAIKIFSEAASSFVTEKDQLNQALALRYLSLAYQHLGNWQEAQEAIAQSWKLLEQQKNHTNTQAYLNVLAKVLNTQGRLQWSTGEWSEAVKTWKQAAATYKKSNNYTGFIGSLINQTTALQTLGLGNQAQTELENLEQIIKQQSAPDLKAIGLQHLGQALRRMGNLRQSQEILQKSLQVAQKYQLSKNVSSSLLELGNTEWALGNRAIAIGKEKDAQQHTRTAIELYQQAIDPSVKLYAQLNLLSLLIETGNWSEALKLKAELQPSVLGLPISQESIYAKLNYARSLTFLIPGIDIEELSLSSSHERWQKLRENPPQISLGTVLPSSQEINKILLSVIQQARTLKNRRAESYALGQLGELYELTGKSSEAQKLTQQALLLAQEVQSPEILYRWEWQLGRLWEKNGEIKRAIAAYETAIETLKSVRGDLLSIDAEVQFSFRDNVEPIYRQLVSLLLKTEEKSEPSQINLYKAIQAIDSLQLAELESFLSCNLSTILQTKQSVHRSDLKVIFDKLDPKAAFIYPIILKDRLEVITHFPGQPLKHHVTFIKGTEVEKTVIDLRASILRHNRPENVLKNAAQIYKWLIEPLEQNLQNNREVRTLVFTLDGALRNVPISNLYDANRQEYLMQKPYALAVLPSLQAFDLKSRQRESLEVLTGGMSEKREVEGRKFNELPNVIRELQQIRSIAPTKSLLNLNFTLANLQKQINSGVFSVVHIATHGNFSSDPDETFLLTYQKLLRSKDLNNLLKIEKQSGFKNIDLLVLSACQTAQGDNRATLGLAGIAVKAGAHSTLATLWQVNDNSTPEFMEQFYKELAKPNVTKAEALHQAQLALFKQYKAHYAWAPYVLVGDWR